MLLEIAISAIPYRFAHVVYTFIYGCCYAAFTLIYWGAGGTRPDGERYIYKPLDYSGLGGKNPRLLYTRNALEEGVVEPVTPDVKSDIEVKLSCLLSPRYTSAAFVAATAKRPRLRSRPGT